MFTETIQIAFTSRKIERKQARRINTPNSGGKARRNAPL
jgi:hypothetical protein